MNSNNSLRTIETNMSLGAFKDHFQGFLGGSGLIQTMHEDVEIDFGEAFEKMFKDGIPIKINLKKHQEVEYIQHNG